MYRGFIKARTPKYTDFKGFNFNNGLSKGDPTSDPNLKAVNKDDFKYETRINVDTQSSSNANFYLDCFKALTNINTKSNKKKQYDSSTSSNHTVTPEKSQNRSQKSDSFPTQKPKKNLKRHQKSHKKRSKHQTKSKTDKLTSNPLHSNFPPPIQKTLEGHLNPALIPSTPSKAPKTTSAPITQKPSPGRSSIGSTQLAARKAREALSRTQSLLELYGKTGGYKQRKEMLKRLHGAAITIQTAWRSFIVGKRSEFGERGVPKLDLSFVKERKEDKEGDYDYVILGVFQNDGMLDLSTKRVREMIVAADLSSMIKIREEALNYKVKKEKSKIQKMLSSQKISPRTGGAKELELEKWVDQQRKEIDQTKQLYEENKKKTQEIIKETMGIDNVFSNYEVTQETLKKLFAEKITTPREGLSFRSGFNSSRRLYEVSNANKQMSSAESEQILKRSKNLTPDSNDKDDLLDSSDEDSKKELTLKQKIEKKLRTDQEITFEKNKNGLFFEQDNEFSNRKHIM